MEFHASCYPCGRFHLFHMQITEFLRLNILWRKEKIYISQHLH
jgi:hypothetical protein